MRSRGESFFTINNWFKNDPQAIPIARETMNQQRHYEWLKGYWTPDRNSYPQLGEQYIGFEWKEAFEPYDSEHPKPAQFLAEGMKIFAENELS